MGSFIAGAGLVEGVNPMAGEGVSGRRESSLEIRDNVIGYLIETMNLFQEILCHLNHYLYFFEHT